MPRRADHSPEEIREMAVEAARRVIAIEGLSALTARRVAGAIGYTVGTLYNHFGNFDEIVLHVNAATIEALTATLTKAGKGPARTALLRLAEAYIEFGEKNPHLWASVIRPPPGAQVMKHDWYVERLAAPLVVVEAALERLDPALTPRRRRLVALTLWGALHGICSLTQEGQTEVFQSPSAREMARIALDGILWVLADGKKPRGN
jgi:AcrR family transcriptional regulator